MRPICGKLSFFHNNVSFFQLLRISLQTGETGRGTVNTVTRVTATSRGRGTDIIRTTRIATRITMVIDVHMETLTAAQAVTATTAPLEKGRMTSTAMTGTTGVIDPIMTGESSSNLITWFSSFLFKHEGTIMSYYRFKNVLNYISGIQTPKEDVLMNSVPTTTREEKALFRTSGGCQSTGRQVLLGQSTIAGPSTLTNLLRCWTLVPRRLRSPPRTPALLLSGP